MSQPPEPTLETTLDSFTLNQVQLLLAEKRTALATLRTGIAIFAFPLSVLSVLITTSKMYRIGDVLHWLIPLLLLNLALVVLAVYLIVRAIRRFRHYDERIEQFKKRSKQLADLIG